MSLYNCHKQEPQPWMSYINPNMITYSGKCCPQLVTTTDRLLPFQIISNGVYVSAEISPYGEDNWTEITIPVSSVYTDGFFIHSYIGSLLESELLCGVYDFRVIACETWWFEPIMVQDFDITVNGYSLVDELMTPFKFTQQIVDTTPLIAPCDMIMPFMFRTENVTSGTITVYMVDESGTETEITITVTTGVIDGMTYYWHSEEYLYPFLSCGRYYLKIVDGANTYYSVPFVPECGISDIPDGYKVLRDFNGCVIRNDEGVIEYEEASDIPLPIENISYGLLYNWYAATDARNIANTGWHVPTDVEFDTLISTVDPSAELYSNIAGGILKELGFVYWNTPNTGASNSSGFNARGAGMRSCGTVILGEEFTQIKEVLSLWTSTDNGIILGYDSAASPVILYNNDYMIEASMSSMPKLFGLPIRLIKDSTSLTHGQTGTYVGNDGKVYRTICIGTQEWMADNLCETLYRKGDPIPEVTDNATWAALITGALCAYNNDWNNV